MTTGLSVDGAGFEVLAGNERIGPRRLIGPDDVTLLTGLADRYVRAVQRRSDSGAFIAIGRELYAWLDGGEAQLTALLDRARTPVVFEVQGPRKPTEQAWAVLRAPFELLAGPDGGFLGADALTRFCVARRLGRPAKERAALDDYRLGLAFMASSPRGAPDLDYEAEEAAILRAVGETNVDLVVDDTGDPEQLARRLTALSGMPAVHLSCHGLNNWHDRDSGITTPALLMETDEGAARPTTAADLAKLLTTPPRLLFVSACLTATAASADGHLPPGNGHKETAQDADVADVKGTDADVKGVAADGGDGLVAHSLATSLITAGTPAVLGWDGSVNDRAATLFAGHLYRAVANRAGLAVAVGDARRALLNSADPHLKSDWHLARLWFGPDGGGPIVAGGRKRSLVTATHGTKTFLDRKQRVPVARADMFVGRRPELQQALRALRSADWAGVLLHGQGRLGKSSLAARLADRLGDYAVAVVFGDYSALGILDVIADAVQANQTARDLIASRLPEVRERPEAIGPLLIDLLSGPCREAGPDGRRPLLLIIDDLEQILVPDPAGPHRVSADLGPDQAQMLAAVLRAFRPAETESRLLLTSRYTFALHEAERRLADVQLRPLSPVAQHKLQRRQDVMAGQTPAGQALLAERSALAERAVTVSRGNPGLQDLIVMRVVYNEEIPLARAESAVTSMETYLARGDLPAEPEIRAFLENLALDALLEEAGEDNVALLRAATLFNLPVPVPVVNLLAAEVGGSVTRLRGLGLLDPYEDPYAPPRPALHPNPLAAGRLDPLNPDERTALATAAVGPLFAAWGGEPGRSLRDQSLDLQLTRLALLADAPAVVAACAADAVTSLRDGPAVNAFYLGQAAIELLDRHDRGVPLDLFRYTASAALTSGDGESGEALLVRAAQLVAADDTAETGSLDQARVIAERARHLITRGEPGFP